MDSKWFCRYEDLYCSNPFLVRTSVQKTTTEERSHRLGDGMWAAALFSSSLYGSSHAAAPTVNGKKTLYNPFSLLGGGERPPPSGVGPSASSSVFSTQRILCS